MSIARLSLVYRLVSLRQEKSESCLANNAQKHDGSESKYLTKEKILARACKTLLLFTRSIPKKQEEREEREREGMKRLEGGKEG